MLNPSQVEQFRTQGYVIIDGFAPEMLEPLRAATGRTITKGRSGDWGDVRACNDGDIWGVSSLLHPDLGEPIFAQYMASPQVLEVAQDLLGPELRLGLTNLLSNPSRSDYRLNWHRDGGRIPQDPEAELESLRQCQESVQWNAALYEESCLFIVPETHRRIMTDEEREVYLHHPTGKMPGELRVHLRDGECVYYNAMLLHRGEYPGGQRRETLHANLVSTAVPWASNYHYETSKFMAEDGFRESLPEKLWPLHERWLEYARECVKSAA